MPSGLKHAAGCRLLQAAMVAFLCGLGAMPARAAFDPVGIWTMTQDGASRQCRLQLRDDVLGAGRAVAMPPGCHRAFPILTGIRSWVQVDDAHVSLNNDADAAILLFEDDGTGHLHALGPEGTDAYTLTAVGARPASPVAPTQAALPTEGEVPATPAPVARGPKPAAASILTPAAVAGHYAVMRGSRDTGCMVTLEDPASRSASPLKARLAPACRDQGIMIFDPVGWQLKAGRLVLTARKGHTADLDRDESGMWVKDSKSPAPLGLKRL